MRWERSWKPPTTSRRPRYIGPEAYVSPEYARAEQDRLWRKVWLQAGRLEDIPDVGNYITYDILDRFGDHRPLRRPTRSAPITTSARIAAAG